jgi:hypothetical protein
MKISLVFALAAGLLLSACQTSQLEASATYIAAEVATTAIIQKNPKVIPVVTQLTQDWVKYQGGTLSATDETALLQSIVNGTKGQLTPVQAALLDGATQQILANQNNSAPTPLQGAAAAIVTDVMNGAARAVAIYTPPTS